MKGCIHQMLAKWITYGGAAEHELCRILACIYNIMKIKFAYLLGPNQDFILFLLAILRTDV
jgi:hypothetical protein